MPPRTILRPGWRAALAASALSFAVACEAPPTAPNETAGEAPATARAVEPIIGGHRSTATDYPSAGALLTVITYGGQRMGSMICTGTLIAPDVALTAAHCTEPLIPGARNVTYDYAFTFTLDVRTFGQRSITYPPRTTHVKKLMRHPGYDPNANVTPGLGAYDDIGLIFLDAPVTDVVPEVVADAADTPFIVRGSTVAIAGYGQTSATNQNSAGVKYEALTIINEAGSHEMQVGDLPPRPQKCHGDSGGPTYMEFDDGRLPRERVIGVTSRAYDESDCGRGGVDTRADAYRDWIEQSMIAACNDGTRRMDACANGGGLAVATAAEPDAGVVDTGFPDAAAPDAVVPDTGTLDAGTPAGDAGVAEDSGSGSGGSLDRGSSSSCTCAAPRGQASGLTLGLFTLLGLAVLARRPSRSPRSSRSPR